MFNILKKSTITLFLSLIILFSFLNSMSYAGLFSKDEAGTTGAQFLKIGCGVRAIGMGEAYSAIADEISAFYWNPAGLNQIEGREISAMHASWLESMNYDYVAYAQPVKRGAIGASINYLSMAKIDRMDEYRQEDGTFSPYDLAINVTYARELGPVMSGVTFKFIQQELDGENATGYAVDLGLLYNLFTKTRLALVVKNIGPEIKFIEEGAPLPLNIRLGLSYQLKQNLIFALDSVAPIDEDISINVGGEYIFSGIKKFPISCRIGYRTATAANLDSLSGLCGGIGFILHGINVDYAWVPYGDLGDTHRISLGMKFANMTEKTEKDEKGTKENMKNITTAQKYYVQSIQLYKEGKYKETMKQTKKVLKLDPQHEKARKLQKLVTIKKYYKEGIKYFKKGKYKQTITKMNKILELDPGNEEVQKIIKNAKQRLAK